MNNTVVRTFSGIAFLVVVLAGLLINKYLFAVLLIAMMGTMLYEFYRMTMGPRYRLMQGLAIGFGVLAFLSLFLVCAFGLDRNLLAVNILLLIALMVGTLLVKDKKDFRSFAFLFMGLLYIAVPLTLSNLVVFDGNGGFSGLLIVAFFCIIWSSDVGAYCFGMLFGKNGRKLFPSISPKKSWAGFWGGLVMSLVAAYILYLTGMLAFPLVHCLVLAALMNVAGVYGDLFESQWKRDAGIKDSGNLIPGHGGALDRFDSTLFAMPAGVAYLLLMHLI